jgi:Xaa-Pro aminopeptidase
MVRLFRWLEQQLASGATITEIDIATRLTALRAALPLAAGDSFGTISAHNAHAALPHYQPTAQSNCVVEPTGLLKLDSGGQYLDGTTDITRTVALGPVTDEMRTMATLVLKGHVAVSMLRFPVGTAGVQIDAIARYPQWTAGFDYDHGTGHGVGAYLSVHEGPQRIAKKGSDVPLEVGMVLSNEPGYYRQGAFGIRTENLIVVQDAGPGPDGRPFLSFETLTLCPYDRRLIDLSLLTAAERAWIDAYHDQVRATLSSGLDGDDLAWLERETAPLERIASTWTRESALSI